MEKYEIVKWLENFKKRLKDISEVIKVEQLKKEIEDNEKVMASENFWPETAFETVCLECRRGNRNSLCSGEMRRYKEEHQWRRRIAGRQLTVRRESVGSKQD